MERSTFVLATRNRHKISEIRSMLSDLTMSIKDLSEYPDCPEVVEDAETIQENAMKKAIEIHRYTKLPAIADDSGLEVEYLLGAPGVFSARYAGESATYADNNRLLIARMRGVPARRRYARFRTVIALAGIGKVKTVEGICEGSIVFEPRGDSGFGYDPLFQPLGYSKTYAEMSADEKNTISHRSKAIMKLKELLVSL